MTLTRLRRCRDSALAAPASKVPPDAIKAEVKE
jgi:hypothetical protein